VAIEASSPLTEAGRPDQAGVRWREALLFSLLTFAITWGWFAALLGPRLGELSLTRRLPDLTRDPLLSLLVLGMFGPMLAALIMRLLVSREGLKGSFGLLRPAWMYLAAVALPAAYVAAVIAVGHLSGLGAFEWRGSTPLLLAFPVVAVINGLAATPLTFGEEYGWRGYLLPRLLPLGELKASLIIGLVWGLWHAPLILIGLNFPGVPGWQAVLVMTLSTMALSALFTRAYVATSGSVLICAVLHAALNSVGDTFTAPAHLAGDPLIVSAGGLVSAALLTLAMGAVYLLRRRRTITPAARDA
jgi:uncharacterized protein